jgi:hypothetical protein
MVALLKSYKAKNPLSSIYAVKDFDHRVITNSKF